MPSEIYLSHLISFEVLCELRKEIELSNFTKIIVFVLLKWRRSFTTNFSITVTVQILDGHDQIAPIRATQVKK